MSLKMNTAICEDCKTVSACMKNGCTQEVKAATYKPSKSEAREKEAAQYRHGLANKKLIENLTPSRTFVNSSMNELLTTAPGVSVREGGNDHQAIKSFSTLGNT